MQGTPSISRISTDRLAGAVLGLALGDALGAPVEAYPPADARRYVRDLLASGGDGSRGGGSLPPGQVTDDTQLTRELLLSIVEAGQFDPAAFAGRLHRFIASGQLIGGGPAAHSTARQLAEGVAWFEAGMPAPYAGNGAAMRAAPLGVLYGGDMRTLARIVAEQARVTHHDPRCAAGAMAIAAAAAIAARREPIEPTRFLAEIGGTVEAIDGEVAATLREMAGWVEHPPEEAVAVIQARGLEPEARNGWHGISSHVVSSVCWSLYAFLRSPADYLEAVCVAIAVGGDTDTLGAMTGGIVGARLGRAGVPTRWSALVSDRGAWRAEELDALACRAAAVVGGDG